MDWIKAFRTFNVPPARYLLQYVVPLFVGGLLVGLLAYQLMSSLSVWLRLLVVIALPIFGLFIAGMMPQINADRKRAEIDNNIHFFVTHMGVLATANLPPVDIMAKLAEKEEYGTLAEAAEEIASLVNSWNMGLPDACRFVSERTESMIFGDFLERLAYALETGEDVATFLRNEQNVVMGDYANQYQANLYGVDGVKEMYMSTMMSVVFLVIFGLITPLLTGTDPSNLTWLVAGMILILETVFVVLLYMRVPNDLLWSSHGERVGMRRRLDMVLPLATMLSIISGAVAYTVFGFNLMISAAIATTPLMILGLPATTYEAGIRRKDDNYPAFIRSLGASTSARGGSPKDVLKRLRRHDFGPLTEDVEALYRRLNMRLDDERAWSRFADETGSNLIEKFTAMFTEGIASGGDAGETGRIVSENAGRILNLRKHRVQTANGFRGMMIGLTAGMAGTLFIGVGLMDVLRSLFTGGSTNVGDVSVGLPISAMNVNVPLLTFIVTLVVIVHAMIGSYMVTTAGGGSGYRVTANMPALMWISALAAEAATRTLATMA